MQTCILVTYILPHYSVMTKLKPEDWRNPKDTVTTAEILGKATTKKLIVEAQRQEQAGRRRSAIDKHERQAKEKSKHVTHKRNEHVLSIELSSNRCCSIILHNGRLTTNLETMNRTRFHIGSKFSSDVDAVYHDLLKSLDSMTRQACSTEEEALIARRGHTRSTNEDEIGWHSTDKTLSGVTSVGERITSLQKKVSSSEQMFAHDELKCAEIDTALSHLARDMAGNAAYDSIAAGIDGGPTWSNADYIEMQEEIDAEKQKTMDLIEKENLLALNQLQDTEKVSRVAHYSASR